MNQTINTATSVCDNFNFVGWKSYNRIKKKAMDQEFSLSGLLISLSIAFFIVLTSAQILNLIFQSLETSKNHENFLNQKIYKIENIKLADSFNDFFTIKKASAFGENSGKIEKWTDYLDMEAGQIFDYSAEFENTGELVWKKGELALETGPFLNTISLVKHSSWERNYQVAFLSHDVLPGEKYVFNFKIEAPQDINGTIQENFQLVSNRFPIKGTTLRLFIDLKSFDMLDDKAEANISVNKISETINTKKVINNSEEVAVKQTEEKIFDEKNISNDFCASLSFVEKQNYENCQTDLQEKNSSDGIVKAKNLVSEPVLRIGLFNSFNAQRLTANDYYDVYSGDSLILSGLRPGYISVVSFDRNKKQYIITTPGITKFSSKPLRFVPRNETAVFTLIDFENRANWNSNINFNQYRKNIEFHYSDQTGKLWIINELPISYYLKGLAETTNYSPVEYQKVIAVAARTYAMYHYNRGIEYNIPDGSTKHGYEHFHLDATYDQVYKGFISEGLLSKLSQAIDETRGAVVTYQDKVVVTPYFSRSDGRTRNWEEVWYGDPKPWLKSVQAPQDAGQELWGHGVGLSARAALIMARDEKKDWQYILKYFYQNTELQKIY